MAMKYGETSCEVCRKQFKWRRHHTQRDATYCSNECKSIIYRERIIKRNEEQFKWKNLSEEEKFEYLKNRYDKKVHKGPGCWSWKGSKDKDGYGYLSGNKTHFKAHRISYEIHYGKIPDGMLVCHKCDNPECTNPEHLFLGSYKQNSEDSVKKGRHSFGEDRPLAKLKDEDVKEIRKMLELGVTMAHLSRKYCVSFMAISSIKHGKTWKHVL